MSSTTRLLLCAWCERVRSSGGRWEEQDLTQIDPAEATHGICPECLAEETRAASVAVDCP
ncbi:MAG TPA: hypothetical protein VMT70_22035 [Vicinamibacteria bacterium]|nr:hypothetical protein [Vicinamibacteria bacterium]